MFRRNHKHPEPVSPENSEGVDAEIQRIVDTYSPIGNNQYIETTTYRYPEKKAVWLYDDEGAPHERRYVVHANQKTQLVVVGHEQTSLGQSVAGHRVYDLTPAANGDTIVTDQGFTARADNPSAGVSLANPGDYVKEFATDGRYFTAIDDPQLSWLETSGLLTEPQQEELQAVSSAVRSVNTYIASSSALHINSAA